ncbi:DUF3990 domain-containing protein [uncultured Adlercreutzia sp.]|uniref:DUF3990 domain-containing protein n=1 Tax=uncultured Adlercreutzia sp. TaxID=875803 RepID=UPI00272E6234|nr:DUF3990 domain-containing protein [uncultured Adlercreutzia sp.]
MAQQITIYHGSDHIIEQPLYGTGNPRNDYGLGFYCTESLDLAKEWGVSDETDGFANEYVLDAAGLSLLDLNRGDYTILHWLAVLLENRTFRVAGDIAPVAKAFILERFAVDYRAYDVVRGYRADDSYFSFANAFLNNALTLNRLEQAMALGNLGEQVVLLSEKAFDRLTFRQAHSAERALYYPRKIARDDEARTIYRTELKVADLADSPTILSIMQEDWRSDDARLRRIVFE